MKRLLKIYGLSSVDDYRLMVCDSLMNGNRTQAKEQFMAMPRGERISFLKDMIYYQEAPRSESIFFFNTLFNL